MPSKAQWMGVVCVLIVGISSGCCSAGDVLPGSAVGATNAPPVAGDPEVGAPEKAVEAPVQIAQAPPSGVELKNLPLAKIPVGTLIGKDSVKGWTNLVMIATPTLTEQDLKDAPAIATSYARMFKFTVLANVARGPQSFVLDKTAVGFAADIKGQDVIVNGENTLGAKLGLFGARILKENEDVIEKDVRQVARTATMQIFDAKSVMRVGKDHVKRVMRHAILVNPQTGRVNTFVWLMTDTREGYQPSENAIQLLPPAMQEKRWLSVDRTKFTLGIPDRDAFALVQLPQGTAIPYAQDWAGFAVLRDFQPNQVLHLEGLLRNFAAKAGQ